MRASTFKDVLFSNADGSHSAAVEPLEDFYSGNAHIVNQNQTAGYVIFTQDLVSSIERNFEYPEDANGNVLSLVTDGSFGDACSEDLSLSSYFGKYTVNCYIQSTTPFGPFGSCRKVTGCDFFFSNDDGEGMHIYGVYDWARDGYELIIFPSGTVQELNSLFPDGSRINVDYYDAGKSVEDNLAMAHTFGKDGDHQTQVCHSTTI